MANNGASDASRSPVSDGGASTFSNSATSSPSHSRSASQQQQQHRPTQPSGLRQSYMPSSSPEENRSQLDAREGAVESQDHGIVDQEAAQDNRPDVQTSLLANYGAATTERQNGAEPYIFRHRPGYAQGYGSFASSYAPTDAGSFEQRPAFTGGPPLSPGEAGIGRTGTAESVAGSITDSLLGRPKKRKATHWLARKAGIRSERMMYVRTSHHVVSCVLIDLLGTSTTISPSLTGYGNIGGSLSRGILSRH